MIVCTGSVASNVAAYNTWSDTVSNYVEEVENIATIRDGGVEPFYGKHPRGHDIIADIKSKVSPPKIEVSTLINDLKAELPNLSRAAELALDRIKSEIRPKQTNIDSTTALEIAESVMFGPDYRDSNVHKDLRIKFAESFDPKNVKMRHISKFDVYKTIIQNLRPRRILTLNYDVEAELAVISRTENIDRRGVREKWQNDLDAKPPNSSRIMCELSGGYTLISDTVDRQRPDAMLEFALGVPDDVIKIMHLHGRYDLWESLIFSKTDYRDLYWRDDPTKAALNQGLKAIFIGNPVLFVGIGMTEADVNRVMEQFVSDKPLERQFPRFLLWSATESLDKPLCVEDERFRMEMYYRYGIYVIFDKDLYDCEPNRASLPKKTWPTKIRSLDESLHCSIEALGRSLRNLKASSIWRAEDFRSISSKFGSGIDKFPELRKDLILWHPYPISDVRSPIMFEVSDKKGNLVGADEVAQSLEVVRIFASGPSYVTGIIAPPGHSKGALSRAIRDSLPSTIGDDGLALRTVTLNAAFATETDSMMHAVSAIGDGISAFDNGTSRAQAIDDFLKIPPSELSEIMRKSGLGKLVIIVNGMQRFLGENGRPVSYEIDNLVHRFRDYASKCAIAASHSNPDLRLILLGTERLQRYLKKVVPEARILELQKPILLGIQPLDGNVPDMQIAELYPDNTSQKIELSKDESVADNYLSGLTEQVLKINPEARPHLGWFNKSIKIDRAVRKRVMVFALSSETLTLACKPLLGLSTDANPSRAETLLASNFAQLARHIVDTLAFVGQPLPKSVLLHSPDIQQCLRGLEADAAISRQLEILDSVLEVLLTKLPLLCRLRGFGSKSKERYALHKAVLAEQRERFGVPLSDSRLANGFNITLYAAQPVDGYTPSRRWHSKIRRLIGFLIRSDKDPIVVPEVDDNTGNEIVDMVMGALSDAGLTAIAAIEDGQSNVDHLFRLASSEVSDCLRAAFAILKGYYSTPALLMNSDADRKYVSTDLASLARRLRELLSIGQTVAVVRRVLRDEACEDGSPLLKPEFFGEPPFYPDDILWIHNEIGVIELVLGRLYKAEAAFKAAVEMNQKYIEFDDRSHNWRRLELNRLQLFIDRGQIDAMRSSLTRLHTVLDDQAERFCSDDSRAEQLSSLEAIIARYTCDPYDFEQDDWVAVDVPLALAVDIAIYLGYRGVHEAIRANTMQAIEDLQKAVLMCQRLGEHRAYAIFQWHLAQSFRSAGRMNDAREAMSASRNASGAVRQSDINHQARVVGIRSGSSAKDLFEPTTIPQLRATLEYARANASYRLQLMALMELGRIYRSSKDNEAALEADSDALAIAARMGHGLKKVSLRNSIAGDFILNELPEFRLAAYRMLNSAVRIGTKIGYNTSVERTENMRVKLGFEGTYFNTNDTSQISH